MSPREHPMQVWMKGYVSRILSVNNQIATKATDDVFEFAEMAIPLLSFNEYGAGILCSGPIKLDTMLRVEWLPRNEVQNGATQEVQCRV